MLEIGMGGDGKDIDETRQVLIEELFEGYSGTDSDDKVKQNMKHTVPTRTVAYTRIVA